MTTSSLLCSPKIGFPISTILFASSSSALSCRSWSPGGTEMEKEKTRKAGQTHRERMRGGGGNRTTRSQNRGRQTKNKEKIWPGMKRHKYRMKTRERQKEIFFFFFNVCWYNTKPKDLVQKLRTIHRAAQTGVSLPKKEACLSYTW